MGSIMAVQPAEPRHGFRLGRPTPLATYAFNILTQRSGGSMNLALITLAYWPELIAIRWGLCALLVGLAIITAEKE